MFLVFYIADFLIVLLFFLYVLFTGKVKKSSLHKAMEPLLSLQEEEKRLSTIHTTMQKAFFHGSKQAHNSNVNL